MFDWKFIDINNSKPHRLFEQLLQEFLVSKFSNFSWKLTKSSSDNNRDVLGICKKEGAKHWAEAKFIYKIENRNISSRRFDSTLISSLLSTDEIVAVHFGTNISFPKSFIQRSLQYNSCIAIEDTYYINKETLERWLYEHPNVAKKYFGKKIELQMLGDSKIVIEELFFLQKCDTFKFEVMNLDSVPQKATYQVKIIIHSYNVKKQPIQVIINQREIIFEKKLYIESGVQVFSLPSENFLRDGKNVIQLKSQEGNILAEKIIEIKYSYLNFTKQQTNFINNFMNRNNEEQIWNIYGKKGTGKTWILDILGTSYGIKQNIVCIDFYGTIEDMKQLTYLFWNLEKIKGSSDEKSNNFYTNLQKMIDEQAFEQAYNYFSENCSGEWIFPKKLNGNLIFIFKNIRKVDNMFYQNILLPIFNYLIKFEQTLIIESEKKLDLNGLVIEQLESLDEIVRFQKLSLPKVQELKELLFNERDILKEEEKNIAAQILSSSFDSLDQLPKCQSLLKKTNNFNEVINVIEKIRTEQDLSESEVSLIFALEVLTELMEIQLDDFDKSHSTLIDNLLKCKYIYKKDNNIYVNKKIPYDPKFKQQQINILYEFYTLTKDIRIAHKIVELEESEWTELKKVIIDESTRLYNKNYYWDALKGYELFINFIKKDHDRIGVEEIDILYNYAECLNHTVSAEKSFEQLNLAWFFAKERGTIEQILHIEGELLSINYWRFTDSYILLTKISSFIDKVEKYKIQNQLTDRIKRGYETAYNRCMVTNLLNDNFCEAKKWMNKNIELSKIHNESRHKGYTLMDYAKGIYHKEEEWTTSLSLLKIACSIFTDSKKIELRRKLDCECEINYVKCLLDNSLGFEEFNKSKEALRKHGFFAQYYKAELKEIFLHAFRNSKIEDMIKKLEMLENSKKIAPSPRVKYLMYHIKSSLQFRTGDFQASSYYAQKCIDVLPKTGYDSYRSINKKNSICLDNEFLFDFRIW